MSDIEKKYELLSGEQFGTDAFCFRIRALRDFADVKAGDLGGYVQYEDTLSHEGNCWIYDGCMVFGGSSIIGDVQVKGESYVFQSMLWENVVIEGRSEITKCTMKDNVRVSSGVVGSSWCCGNAIIEGHVSFSHIGGNAHVKKDADVRVAVVLDNAVIETGSEINLTKAVIFGDAVIDGTTITCSARISTKQGKVRPLFISGPHVDITVNSKSVIYLGEKAGKSYDQWIAPGTIAHEFPDMTDAEVDWYLTALTTLVDAHLKYLESI
jgi:NDP-sugar pyrophosphorylase family protein